MPIRSVFVFSLVVCLVASGLSQGMQGDMDASHAKDMVKIHALLGDSTKVKRTFKNIPGGISSLTECDDPKIAKLIQEHVKAMQRRLKDGKPIRDWDPLFAAIFENHGKVTLAITQTKKGVSVKETSKDPRVVELIRAHAAAVSGFVKDGMAGMHKSHPVPVAASQAVAKFLGKGDGITTCPVTGEPINKSVSAVIDGRTIYFCCAGCIETVRKNPKAYLKPPTGK